MSRLLVSVWGAIEWVLPIALAAAVVFSYFQLGAQSWFLQEDFILLDLASGPLQWISPFDESALPRFVSQVLYWWLGYQIVGPSAQGFYLMSGLLVLLNAWLVARIVSRFVANISGRLLWIYGIVYPAMGVTLEGFAWISNTQHLLGHTFVFVVLILSLRVMHPRSPRAQQWDCLILISLVWVGVQANVFVGLALSLLFVALIDRALARQAGFSRWVWASFLLAALGFLLILVAMQAHADGAYTVSLSWSVFLSNLNFYLPSSSYALPIGLLMIWQGVSRRRWGVEWIWLWVAPAVFYLPFAFLEHQRYPVYFVLPSLFFVLACGLTMRKLCSVARLPIHLQALAALFVLLWAFLIGLETRLYRLEHPMGADQKQMVLLMKDEMAARPEVRSVCFRPVRSADDPLRPPEWWFVGFGRAFQFFVDPSRSYYMEAERKPCDALYQMEGDRLLRLR